MNKSMMSSYLLQVEDEYILVTNNLTFPDFCLYSMERSGKFSEIQDQRFIRANYPFEISIYMISEFCINYTYICTINSTFDSSLNKIINDSDAPDDCKSPYLYYITITNNLSEIEECNLYYLSNQDNYIPISDQYTKKGSESFSVDIYIRSKKCDEYTYILTVNSSLDKAYEKVILDNDVPNECLIGYKYFLTISNNFTDSSYNLYYTKSDEIYRKLDSSYYEKSTLDFSIEVYMTSDYCLDITYICTINSSTDPFYEVIINDDDAPDNCQSPYKYFITIINNFTKSDFHLYYLNNNKYYEIGNRYSEHGNSTFNISLYITSYKCQQYTYITTIESVNDKEALIVINDSYAPSYCLATYYVTVENQFSRTDFHLYYLKTVGEYEEIIEALTINSTDQFSIELYMSSQYCTNYNFIIMINSTLNDQLSNVINDSYAPYICNYESNYFLTIVNGFTISDYTLYYYSDSLEGYQIIENSIFLSYPSDFSVRIYMKSENCPNYKMLYIARSSTDKTNEKIILNSDVPEVCQLNKYFITIVNNFTESDFHLFYSLDKRMFTEITNSTLIQHKSEFTVYLYMKSDLCRSYTLINTTTSSVNKEYKKEIDDSYAPTSCKSPYQYFITVKNNFTLFDYHLYYSQDEENEYKEISDTIYIQNTTSFSINLYMKSDICHMYTFICKIDSQMSRLYEKVIENIDAPDECTIYEVCFDLNSISDNYSLGYSLSFDNESEISNTSHGTIVIKGDRQFNVSMYLISSPGCSNNTFLTIIQSELDFLCIELNESMIPDECKYRDGDDDDSSSKKKNVPLIAGLTSAIFVLIVISVVVSMMIIIKKRKNGEFLNNTNINENLNDDNNYTINNTN